MFGNKENDEEEQEQEEAKYNFDEECENCFAPYSFEIPFGTTVKDFIKDKKCENCGCNIIKELQYYKDGDNIIKREMI